MTEFQYTIVLKEGEDGGYWTQVPALPGCGSQGATVQEAIEMTRGAIRAYIHALLMDGEPVPTDVSKVATVVVAA